MLRRNAGIQLQDLQEHLTDRIIQLVDFTEKGLREECALDEVKELYGFDTAAIVTMEEVVEHLYNRPYKGKVIIDDTLKAAIDAYYEMYGAK